MRAIPKDDDNSVHFRISPRIVSTVQAVDLRSHFPPAENQRELGSCSSYAIGAAYQYNQVRQHHEKPFTPSHLFLYYCERELQGTIHEDSGARLSTGVEVVSKIGVVPEPDWPYTISQFAKKPPESVYVTAKNHRCDGYYRVGQTQDQIHQALINGFPVIIGLQIYPSFESAEVAKTGIVPMPNKRDTCLGGHAVLIVGFDNATQRYLVRNSWGPEWGQRGYFTMPYLYAVDPDLADDIWVLTSVTDTETMVPMPNSQLRSVLAKLEDKLDSLSQTLVNYVDNLRNAAEETNICPAWLCDSGDRKPKKEAIADMERRMSMMNEEIEADIRGMLASLSASNRTPTVSTPSAPSTPSVPSTPPREFTVDDIHAAVRSVRVDQVISDFLDNLGTTLTSELRNVSHL